MPTKVYPEADLQILRELYARHALHRIVNFERLFKAAQLELPDAIKWRFADSRMSSYKAYKSWRGMLARCNNPNDANYPHYGGRGIQICDRWASFWNFYEDMGERPEKHSLDRIDPSGNYEPGNCRWATPSVQAWNTRNRRLRHEKAVQDFERRCGMAALAGKL